MNRKFVSVLRCPEPECHGDVEITDEEQSYNGYVNKGTLTCTNCERDYRIRDGTPIMMASELDDGAEIN